ncbi:MAG TPA: hypothetical protein VI462_06755 [Acidimicrobiia bacterium]
MGIIRTFGSYLLVAALASVVTVFLLSAGFAGATNREAPAGTIYSQTCTVNASVYECAAGQGCHQVKDPIGHVGNGSGTSLDCKYP